MRKNHIQPPPAHQLGRHMGWHKPTSVIVFVTLEQTAHSDPTGVQWG